MDGLLYAYGAAQALRRRLEAEWFGTPFHLMTLGGARASSLAANPHDLRPTRPDRGREIVEGVFTLAGTTLRVGPNGDPFDRPSPSRRFAEALHGFAWMGDLMAAGEGGVRPGVRLYMDWRRLFGRWNGFAWSARVLERRVFNLACAAKALTAQASEAEIEALTGDLARQARHLLAVTDDPSRACERAAAAVIAGCALGGKPGDALVRRGLGRLNRKLKHAVLPDGGHATRSPQQGLELLFDLLTLDDALSQRARPSPEPVMAAIDRLGLATRFFTLADGKLAAFHGGAAVDAPT
ncbi:MAG TPA: heparinase, partial [Caulobacteraceae bacterium]